MLFPAVDNYINHNQYGADGNKSEAYLFELLVDKLLIAAKEIAGESENHDPNARAQRGIEGELRERHSRKAGRQRDILAYHRKQPAGEGAYMSMAGEEDFRLVERFARDEKVLSVFFEDRASPADGDPVIEEAA